MASDIAASSIDYETVGPAYTSPGIASCPPLLQLRAYGICCPFFETEEDHEARVGAQILTNYPITWYRKQVFAGVSSGGGDENATNNHSALEGGGFIDGLVTGVDKLFVSNKSSMYCGVPATLSIIDTEQCGPLIKVKAIGVVGKENTHATRLPSISIPLHLVDSVSAGWSLIGDNTEGGIKLFARKQLSNGLLGINSGEEILRFDTLGGGGDDWSEAVLPAKLTEPNEHVDKIIARLRALIAWNRKRMTADVQQGKIVTPSNFVEIS
mmetsp:Transcript_19653/g.32224  ORF Transcript_19653/g.32224 Transcript_19653/m.32224 type:complete len:268 (+) Transcript_19653:73-876(+)